MSRLPNFVVIFTDDQGYNDLGCFGSPDIRTPNIDQMANEGMKFTDFYVGSPVCTPSRAAIMTGCYPQRVGMGGRYLGPEGPALVLFPQSDTGLSTDEITIAKLLKQKDYATACFGKWHLGHLKEFHPLRHGFDYYFGIPYSNDMEPTTLLRNYDVVEEVATQATLTERYTEEAIKFMTENKDNPFFVYLPHTMPHTPLHVSERWRGKSKRGLYGDVVECIDWSTGEILQSIKDLGIDEHTFVIFTSDNGPWLVREQDGGTAYPLRSGKGTCFEGGQREPCVMRWPGKIPAGTVCSKVTTSMDLLPTFAYLAGLEPPQDRVIDGKDIRPLMFGEEGAESPHEAFYYYFMDHLHAVRSGKWKLHIAKSKQYEFIFRQIDDPETIQPEALYDLENDIGEHNNVIDQYPEVAERLRGLMDKMRNDLGDMPMSFPAIPGVSHQQIEGKGCRPVGRAMQNQ